MMILPNKSEMILFSHQATDIIEHVYDGIIATCTRRETSLLVLSNTDLEYVSREQMRERSMKSYFRRLIGI